MLRGERLIIMPGTEQMEWNQTPGNHVFDVFDTVPLIPLQPLPQARSPQLWVPSTSCGICMMCTRARGDMIHVRDVLTQSYRAYRSLSTKAALTCVCLFSTHCEVVSTQQLKLASSPCVVSIDPSNKSIDPIQTYV